MVGQQGSFNDVGTESSESSCLVADYPGIQVKYQWHELLLVTVNQWQEEDGVHSVQSSTLYLFEGHYDTQLPYFDQREDI